LAQQGVFVPATDIYAATAVLCESVTGKPPFSARLGQLRHQHESAPVPLDQFERPLQDLIARGMAKNPADRPRARSFVSELEARAAAAYGPYWEDQGRRELADRATALLPLLAGGGGGSAMATRIARRKIRRRRSPHAPPRRRAWPPTPTPTSSATGTATPIP
jgi:hypothetical protein